MKVREVLVHRPGPEITLIDKPRKWLFSDYPSLTYMQREHDELVKALENEGVKVHLLLKPSKNKPKAYITMDDAVIVNRKAVACHLAYSVRRGEEQLVKIRLKELRVKIMGHIFVPGFLHGSDLFFTDKDHAFACVGNTTNIEGIEHLMKILKIRITPLKMENVSSSKLNIIDDIAIMSEELTYEPAYNLLKDSNYDIIIVPKIVTESMGLNFLQVDDRKIINIKSGINKKLKMYGYDVIELDIRELLKGNCGIRNMCLPFY